MCNCNKTIEVCSQCNSPEINENHNLDSNFSVKRLVIMYVETGNLNEVETEALIDKMKNDSQYKLERNVVQWFIPTRSTARVEVIYLN